MKIRVVHFMLLMAFTLYLGACGNQINEIDMSCGTIQEEQAAQGQEGPEKPEGLGLEGENSESGNEE